MTDAWIVCDKRKTGTYNQCLGVATALDLYFESKAVDLSFPWSFLPAKYAKRYNLTPEKLQSSDGYKKPWPRIIIAGGRQSATMALSMASSCYTIFVQDPRVDPSLFNLVVAPKHDELSGKNVIETIGSIHSLTKEKVEKAAVDFAVPLNGPYVSVLLGGDSHYYRYTPEAMQQLAVQLRHLITYRYPGASLLITPSRRTKKEHLEILRAALEGVSFDIWNGSGDNPYLAYLGIADALVVTGDSVSMASEACVTGKPVHIFELPLRHPKFQLFYKQLYLGDHARPLNSEISAWDHQSLNELKRITPIVKSHLNSLFL